MQINHYDAEGLRHEIEENGQLVQFIFSDREVVVEKTESDTLRLIRGYDITASESEQAKTYYHYASDEMGSTTHIFEGQDLRNRYEYDAFGNIVVSEEQVSNRFKYTGQQHDPITQQYYLRARFYNPVIARFTQEDPYRGAGLNLYAYCDNNPVSYFDPSGYSPCPTKQDLYKKYRAEGYNATDANRLANMDLTRNGSLAGRTDIYAQIVDIELNTGAKLSDKQILAIMKEHKTGNYSNKLPTQELRDQHRADFNKNKNALIAEWEKNTDAKWPQYTKDKISKKGDGYVYKEGANYDAHEILPNAYNGPLNWCNITPVHRDNHQPGVHSTQGVHRQAYPDLYVKNKKKKK